ncbi:hypothetical protein PP935_gp147 [Rhizobium phage RHph_N34]|uniref:Uncharacterized protein n=1 Tax=Rhizobium phage RHph_N34 TaxID=2509586 RepID=A0A7S5RA36_9CAUD|nr:hypothetical protein PP935_gp147 [Rhizobium phage RHph_N34]QIG73922.1 hypothetical protein EVC06_147 [Rhizobium phage RHph_N34]
MEYYVLAGLLIVAVTSFVNKLKWLSLLLIPLSFGVYFVYASKIPQQFGYPIDWNVVTAEKATFLYGTEGADFIYMTVLEENSRVPRLVSVKNTKENREALQELIKKQQEGLESSVGGHPRERGNNHVGDFQVLEGAAGGQEVKG